jgi:hypothetical protein
MHIPCRVPIQEHTSQSSSADANALTAKCRESTDDVGLEFPKPPPFQFISQVQAERLKMPNLFNLAPRT